MRARDVAIACVLMTAPLAADEQVSLELLDFLGSFETADGKWIDPTRLEVAVPELRNAPKSPPVPQNAEEKTDE